MKLVIEMLRIRKVHEFLLSFSSQSKEVKLSNKSKRTGMAMRYHAAYVRILEREGVKENVCLIDTLVHNIGRFINDMLDDFETK